VVPVLGGNGLAMRCGMTLEALAATHRVSLLVVPLYPPFGAGVPEHFERLCEHTALVPSERAEAAYRSVRFDVVHAFRLAALPFARPHFPGSCRSLDMDDIESRARRGIAALQRMNGDDARADLSDAEARRYTLLEGLALRMLDRVCVCSEADRQRLLGRCRAEIAVWPNAVRPPAARTPRRPGVFRLLFIGTLGYYPNRDAVEWFCSAILPLIARDARVPFEVDIVGAGAADLAAPGARLLGAVPDLQPVYDAAHAVVVPLRAGGGTRIKILEAFSYGRPVVATPMGIEGIDAVPDEHALVAESAEAFAAACVRLMSDWELGERLARNATELWACRYSGEALRRAVDAPAAPPVHPESR
jgi:glycosyltransferase involved in cell wall biosynthesis